MKSIVQHKYGAKVKAVIDKRFTLAEVPEALQHQGEDHTQGKSVITVSVGEMLAADQAHQCVRTPHAVRRSQ